MHIQNTAVEAEHYQLKLINPKYLDHANMYLSGTLYVVLRVHPRGEARKYRSTNTKYWEAVRARTKYGLTIRSARVHRHAFRLSHAKRWYQY